VLKKQTFPQQKQAHFRCAKTVPEFNVFDRLKLTASEKQIPQVVENIEK